MLIASLNLKLSYYKAALKIFPPEKFSLFIFSDDIDYAKSLEIFRGYKTFYSENNSPAVDMCLMSLCDNNIIANSSFSFWGAMLNKNPEKLVVCPYNFIGGNGDVVNNYKHIYMNGHWFPSSWVSIKRGNRFSCMSLKFRFILLTFKNTTLSKMKNSLKGRMPNLYNKIKLIVKR